jgi:hypothetical protein
MGFVISRGYKVTQPGSNSFVRQCLNAELMFKLCKNDGKMCGEL